MDKFLAIIIHSENEFVLLLHIIMLFTAGKLISVKHWVYEEF